MRRSVRSSNLLPLLVFIQAHLDEDLSLEVLAERSGSSASHFHAVFKAIVGETPKRHVERLRLERAAFRLLVQEATILEIALDCGFANHETFTRAFRRRFEVTPDAYRKGRRSELLAERVGRDAVVEERPYALSRTTVRRLKPAHLAFIRHVGPYEEVSDSLYDRLEGWARRRGEVGPRVWMGIGHDAPGQTAAEELRFDAALVVGEAFEGDGEVGYQWFEGGDFAVTTHAGPFGTLPAAYGEIFPRVVSLPRHELIGLPAVELYRASRVRADLELNVTEICLPVRPR